MVWPDVWVGCSTHAAGGTGNLLGLSSASRRVEGSACVAVHVCTLQDSYACFERLFRGATGLVGCTRACVTQAA